MCYFITRSLTQSYFQTCPILIFFWKDPLCLPTQGLKKALAVCVTCFQPKKWIENIIKRNQEICLLYQKYFKPMKPSNSLPHIRILFRQRIWRILPPPVRKVSDLSIRRNKKGIQSQPGFSSSYRINFFNVLDNCIINKICQDCPLTLLHRGYNSATHAHTVLNCLVFQGPYPNVRSIDDE